MSDKVLPDVDRVVSIPDAALIKLAVGAARLLVQRSPSHLVVTLRAIRRRAAPASYAEASRALNEILSVSSFCRNGSACLPRSVATCLLCRSRGVWPTWSTGVLRSPPFGAHAWVQVADQIVDEPLGIADYAPLLTVGPLDSVVGP
jgi:hypothetical protein